MNVEFNDFFLLSQGYVNNVLGSSKSINPTFDFGIEKNYADVCLKVKDSFGCVDVFCDTLRLAENAFRLIMPNVFTPGNDGKNDVFQPKGVGITSFQLNIFDRWGHKVFSTNDLLTPWDGTINGDSAKFETYLWNVEFSGSTGKTRKLEGYVNVIR